MENLKKFCKKNLVYIVGALSPIILVSIIGLWVVINEYMLLRYGIDSREVTLDSPFGSFIQYLDFLLALFISPLQYVFGAGNVHWLYALGFDIQNEGFFWLTVFIPFMILGVIYAWILKVIYSNLTVYIEGHLGKKRKRLIEFGTLAFLFVVLVFIGSITGGYIFRDPEYPRLTQTCLTAPGSTGCRSCMIGQDYIVADKKGRFFVLAEVGDEYRQDAQLCAECENQYQRVASGEIELEDISVMCLDPSFEERNNDAIIQDEIRESFEVF